MLLEGARDGTVTVCFAVVRENDPSEQTVAMASCAVACPPSENNSLRRSYLLWPGAEPRSGA